MPDFNLIDGKHIRICMTCGNKQILHQLPELTEPSVNTTYVAKLLTHKKTTNTQCFAHDIETCKDWAKKLLDNTADKVIIYEVKETKVIELNVANLVTADPETEAPQA